MRLGCEWFNVDVVEIEVVIDVWRMMCFGVEEGDSVGLMFIWFI